MKICQSTLCKVISNWVFKHKLCDFFHKMQNPFGDNMIDYNYLIHLDICKISFCR